MTGRWVAAARPTGPPPGPNGSWAHGLSSPGANPSVAAQTSDWSGPGVGPRIGDQVNAEPFGVQRRPERGHDQRQAGRGVGRHQPVGQAMQPGELAAGSGVHRLAGDQRHHIVRVGADRVEVGDDPALAQHHDAVGQPEHLIDVVAGQQDRGALLAQPGDELLDLSRLHHPERGGGLVQGQQPGFAAHGPGHGHQLALAAGQRTDLAGGVTQRDAQAVEQGGRRPVEAAVGEHHPARLAAEQHVGRDVQVLAQGQVLPDHGHALPGRGGRVRGDPAAGDVDLTLAGGDVPGDAAHQRGLAGAVLAGQRDQLARADGQAHAVQGLDRTEPGGQTGHRQQRRHRWLGQLGSCDHSLIVWPVRPARQFRRYRSVQWTAPGAPGPPATSPMAYCFPAAARWRAGCRPTRGRSPPWAIRTAGRPACGPPAGSASRHGFR